MPCEAEALSRRELLRTGVSLTAYASMATLFGARWAMADTPSFPPQRRLIWINMSGGWDLLEVTDPKTQSTSGLDMVYSFDQTNALADATDGTRLGRWLPEVAAIGRDLLVVRGMAMGTTSHAAGSVYMDTGVLSNTGRVNAASIPAIVASESKATIPIIQLAGGSDPATDRGLLNPVSVVRAENLALYRSMYPADAAAATRQLAVLDFLKGSLARLEGEVGATDRTASLAAAEEKVRAQFQGDVGAKLSLNDTDRTLFRQNPPKGLSTSQADAFALALKLITGDIVTCINLGVGGFDTHQNQTPRLQPIMANVDFLLARLVQGLRTVGMLDQTLIVLYSDFGRTPRVNAASGRDHWPVGGALVIGGGIDGGRSVGATGPNLEAANLVDPTTGLETTDGAVGVQLNPTHLGGMVLALTLGSGYAQYRPYLEALPALTRLRGA